MQERAGKSMDQEEIKRKREREKYIVRFMIGLYCHKNHKTPKKEMCAECLELADYADKRVDHCPHTGTKTFCSSCRTHCYAPAMRDKIRKVMRFSGPRMILYCPEMAIRHAIESIKS